MIRRPLGKTGLEVSLVSIGGIPFQRVDAAITTDILRRAVELGINFIDTARGYTVSEEYIGEALETLGREKFYLATKSMQRTRQGILSELAVSLKNLRTETIDLYQFHNVATLQDYEILLSDDGAYKAVMEKKAEGVIGHVGITSHSLDILKLAVESDLFETIQFPYNAVERQGEELFRKAHEKGIGLIVMKPYAGGAIMKKELAMRFLLENPAVSAVIPGVDCLEQLEMNASLAMPFVPLSEAERAELKEETDDLGNNFCRRCGYCKPCAVGIDIPMTFLFEGYYSRYNLKEWTMARYGAAPYKARDCMECGLCESRCPYHLPIIEMMKKASRVLDREGI